jgi:hypothetical protein
MLLQHNNTDVQALLQKLEHENVALGKALAESQRGLEQVKQLIVSGPAEAKNRTTLKEQRIQSFHDFYQRRKLNKMIKSIK